MAIDGQVKILPEEARARANSMKSDAKNLESLLNDVRKKMEDINDESLGTYHGAKRPSELKAELDAFSATFSKFYEQIEKYANDVIAVANTMENE